MRLRSFGSLVTLAIVVVWLAPVFLFGQSRAAGAKVKPDATKPWTAPHTPDGQPDLQGIWLNNDATPLERPKALEGKPFLTDEEVAELKKRAVRIFGSDANSDAAGGDNFFLALLANPDVYKNPNATGGFQGMRAIDNPNVANRGSAGRKNSSRDPGRAAKTARGRCVSVLGGQSASAGRPRRTQFLHSLHHVRGTEARR